MSRMGMPRTLGLFFAVGLLVPGHASAQHTSVHPSTTEATEISSAASAAGRLAPAASALTLLPSAMAEDHAAGDWARQPVPQVRDRRGIPLMVAGAVAFVAGAIVGGDGGAILMVGGAVVGAYGTYVYFGGS